MTVRLRAEHRAPPAWSAREFLKVDPTTVMSTAEETAPPAPPIADAMPVNIQEMREPAKVSWKVLYSMMRVSPLTAPAQPRRGEGFSGDSLHASSLLRARELQKVSVKDRGAYRRF